MDNDEVHRAWQRAGARVERVGIFGGGFDPPHLGHQMIARAAVDQLNLEILYWTPAHRPPHKKVSDSATRLELVEAAISGQACERFQLLDFEIRRDEISYSYETIRHVSALHPRAQIFFILGSDALAILPTWHRAEEVLSLVTFAVYDRGGAIDGAIRLEGAPLDISSSDIRARLRKCLGITDREGVATRSPGAGLVTPKVAAIIERNVLYACPMPFLMRAHVNAVIEAAVALAERWNLPPETLKQAARYHDAYRTMPHREAIELLIERGETVDEIERSAPILLHGRVAALRMIANRSGDASHSGDWDRLAWDMINAVRYHTTGRAGMSPIEETLFIADRIEKDWNRIDDVPTDRRGAMRDALTRKRDVILKNGETLHPRMIAAAREYGVSC